MSVSISVSPVVFPELSLTSHNLSTVLDSMDDWLWELFSRYVNIPESEVKRIRSKYSSSKEHKQAAIDYLISSHPAPSSVETCSKCTVSVRDSVCVRSWMG